MKILINKKITPLFVKGGVVFLADRTRLELATFPTESGCSNQFLSNFWSENKKDRLLGGPDEARTRNFCRDRAVL